MGRDLRCRDGAVGAGSGAGNRTPEVSCGGVDGWGGQELKQAKLSMESVSFDNIEKRFGKVKVIQDGYQFRHCRS